MRNWIGRACGRAVAFAVAVAVIAGAAVVADLRAGAASCKPNAEAKGVSLYDGPGGGVLRTVDVDPTWVGGAMQMVASGDGATAWLEVKDATGAVVGYLSSQQGGFTCTGGF